MVKSAGKQVRVTRGDVAKRAGISQTTVAYVLNETPGVKIREETRAKVLRAAQDLGYKPSFSARSMKRGRTELVGILTPDLSSQFHPFYSQMLHGVYEAAAESDYHFLTLTQNRPEKYRRCLSQNYLDGVIVIQSDENWQPIEDVVAHELPAVSLNVLHSIDVTQITMDYEQAMQCAVDKLIADGSRKLLFVHGNWVNQPNQRYLQTFRQLEAKHGDTINFDDLGIDRFRFTPMRFATLLNEGWDGLIIDGYEFAREITLQTYSDKSSQSIPMVVFNETAGAVPLGENITILQSQPQQTGLLAWQLLLEQLENKSTPPSIRRLPFLQPHPHP